MKQYDKYQTVTQKWVDKIPEHWDFYRIKRVFAQRVEKNDPVITENILSLTAKQGVVPIAEKEGTGGNKPKGDMTQYNVAHPNDLLINCMNIVAGSAGVSRYFGAISPVYYALYPRLDCNIWYYHYLFRLMPFQRSLLGLGKGILMHESDNGKLNTVRMRISMDNLGNVPLPVPSREEQDQIVRYLDWQVSKINRLISAKRKEIKLLTEYHRSSLRQLISVGLNTDSVMVNSGIIWQPQMPSNWRVLRGKYILQKKQLPVLESDGVVTCFRDGQVCLRTKRRTEGFTNSILEIGYQGIEEGDLAIHGMDGFAGAIGISEDRGKCSPIINVCTAKRDDVYLPFICQYLRMMAYNDVFVALSTGIRERSCDLRWNKIADLQFALPPMKEQIEICNALEALQRSVAQAKAEIQKRIDTLEDLRTRLISDVVTGQIDVRDVEISDFEYTSETDNNGEDVDEKESDDMAEEEV